MLAAMLLALAISAGPAQASSVDSASQLLRQAESAKTSDHPQFIRVLAELEARRSQLSPEQRWKLQYLTAWEATYQGDYKVAVPLLEKVTGGSGDAGLQLSAEATLINILGFARRYNEAYSHLTGLLEKLPKTADPDARFQAMGEASQLYVEAGQYELATRYAERMLAESTDDEERCKAAFLKLRVLYRSGTKIRNIQAEFDKGVSQCLLARNSIFANEIRADYAAMLLDGGRPADAIGVLDSGHDQVVDGGYQSLMSRFDSLLATGYWKRRSPDRARHHALLAVDEGTRSDYKESLSTAYRVLYEMDQQRGDYRGALAYHKKYVAADRAHLNDVTAAALAYQMVRQQVQAKKAEVDALARKNQILELQQALDRKAVEASRLYIAVLVLGLLAIGLWLLRLKRSQLAFMRMAQCDSLTGIYNRKHFMSESEYSLRYAERSSRGACLVLIDLDHFKLINDTYGHATGDQVLRRAVAACQEHVRSTDVFGRLGGEEFGVLLPECGMESGIERAEAIRHSIAILSDQEDPGIPVSASFGVAFTGETGYDLRQLLMDADHALYRAKRAGRNCVVAGKQGEGVVVA